MCGRFTLTDPSRIRAAFQRFRFDEFSHYRLPRFNVAPAQMVLGVRNDGRAAVEAMHWGIDGRINARAETIDRAQTPRRCIIFADGFYEWSAGKPSYFSLRDGVPFAFAGLWQAQGDAAPACTIVTCRSNDVVAAIHDRMPVILPPEAVDVWLSSEDLPHDVRGAMLRPYEAAEMRSRAVSTRLNDARYDAPDILLHEDPVQQSFGL